MSENEEHLEEGVDFTDVDPVLEDVDYPLSREEFVEEYGDLTVERTNADPITIAELFAGTGEDTFENPEGVRQAIMNLMPAESVGRQRYSDRGGSTPDEGQIDESDESF